MEYSNEDSKDWHVVYVGDPRKIGVVQDTLKIAYPDCQIWTPYKVIYRKIQRKTKKNPSPYQKRPIFSGYLFVKFKYDYDKLEDQLNEIQLSSVLKMPGSKEPYTLTEKEYNDIRVMEAHQMTEQGILEAYDIKEGDVIKILHGPFMGYKGKVLEVRKGKVKVEVTIFGRSVPAEVDPHLCSGTWK